MRKVLIVDDSSINRNILCKILGDQYELLQAENGKEALAILKKYGETISIVLLDLVMPIMNGYEFLSIRNADRDLRNIPVIVITQQDSEDDEVKALLNGASDYITKPYKVRIIRHRISNLIQLRENSAMVNLVKYDKITGLYNKEFFFNEVRLFLEENPHKEYDIICSDIENFKMINDIFGVKLGDQILDYVAGMVRHLAVENRICGRLGGDIFGCLTERHNNYSEKFFDDCLTRLDEHKLLHLIALDFGIYAIHNVDLPVSTMCDRATLAIESIKGKFGKSFVCYNDIMRQKLLWEQSITESMAIALIERQFVVYFQPKYNISNNKIVGAEALVRWMHPQKGFMVPDKFIPIFEKNGFITQLDEYVWDATCAIIRGWIDAGIKPVPVSVNVSRVDIYNINVLETMLRLIAKYRLEPCQIYLEITESAYSEDSKQLIKAVTELRAHGFIIEMDDFGKGYSSLSILSELPIDILKLDMNFIKNVLETKGEKDIVMFIIQLSKWLHLPVIAEGVETREQVEELLRKECYYAQGYYFAKPMPSQQFAEYLKTAEIDKIAVIGEEIHNDRLC